MKHPLFVAVICSSFLGCFDFENAFHQYCDSGGCGSGTASTGGGGGTLGGGGGAGGGSTEDAGHRDGGLPDGGPTDMGTCDASLCLASRYLAPTTAMWSVAAASSNDVWASGSWATWAHWDGVAWTSGHLPINLAKNRLYAVAVTPSYVLLGGDDGIFRKPRDGGTWALDHAIDTSNESVYGLWADADDEQFATGYLHWILRGDGSHWADELRETTTPAGDPVSPLEDIDGKAGHIYATGAYENSGAGVVWRRLDAGLWQQEPIPTNDGLETIAVVSSSSVWAVGNGGVVIERQADAGWRQHDFPATVDLEAVWASSPTDVWVGGWGGALWHWDGLSWVAVSPPGLTADFDIFDISGAGTTDLFLAATYDTHIGSYGAQFDGGHVFHYRRH